MKIDFLVQRKAVKVATVNRSLTLAGLAGHEVTKMTLKAQNNWDHLVAAYAS
ncbi:MAG: hypothetical protein IH623_19385 [Verrucomicrobia bacterium]|nr:hypothetical protein [Verrucomicrobiota bacterium]